MSQAGIEGGLQGRVAMVTGAAQGIGRAVAQRLAGEGMQVAIVDANAVGAREAASPLKYGSAWPCDVKDRAAVRRVAGQVQAQIGPVEVLVNCAGIWRYTPVMKVDEPEWDEVFAVNLKGVLFCSQEVGRSMAARRSGKIVNIASVAGFGGNSAWSAYCASKAAAISLTLVLADALEGDNVQVNAVCPGGTDTPMSQHIARTEGQQSSDTMHRPEEVAEEVFRLVSPFDQTTTGVVVAMKPQASVLGVPTR